MYQYQNEQGKLHTYAIHMRQVNMNTSPHHHHFYTPSEMILTMLNTPKSMLWIIHMMLHLRDSPTHSHSWFGHTFHPCSMKKTDKGDAEDESICGAVLHATMPMLVADSKPELDDSPPPDKWLPTWTLTLITWYACVCCVWAWACRSTLAAKSSTPPGALTTSNIGSKVNVDDTGHAGSPAKTIICDPGLIVADTGVCTDMPSLLATDAGGDTRWSRPITIPWHACFTTAKLEGLDQVYRNCQRVNH